MKRSLIIFAILVLVGPQNARAASDCPEGTLLEPYQGICAAINDVRADFVPAVDAAGATPERLSGDAPPVPGKMSAGTRFDRGRYQVTTSSHLHTKMMVYPDGLGVQDLPSWIYTTSTNRTHLTIEVVGMYRSWKQPTAQLGLFAWPCFEDYPCPDGDTSSGWQFWHNYDDLACNITQIVDQGDHAQKIIHYANHADRLDDGDPPAWRNSVFLWNYCEEQWDLIWQHEYKQAKKDCSIDNSCAWWGPVFELFGTERYPEIPELGYEESLLIYDGVRSELRPAEGAGFIDPASSPNLIPWQLFHQDPNRGYGAGNAVNMNDPPLIEAQQSLSTLEDEPLTIAADSLTITDPDVDSRYHVGWQITVYNGDDYLYSDQTITPAEDFEGLLSVPISVSDGAAESQTFDLQIDVIGVNDAPVITGQSALSTIERTPITIELSDVVIDDPDSDVTNMTIMVQDSNGYRLSGNSITPEPGIVGDLRVIVTVNDGEFDSDPFQLLVVVTADVTPPQISLIGDATVTLAAGSSYQDAGATAVDELDGDITDRIIMNNPVNTSVAGNYAIEYEVSDFAGNSASISRAVNVTPDVTPPEIALNGASSVTLTVGDSYLDAGATAMDDLDGDISARIVTENSVNTARAGSYTVSYTVSDLAGNSASTSRSVIVNAGAQPSKGGGSIDLALLLALLLAGSGGVLRNWWGARDSNPEPSG